MARATGVGGIFLRAADPARLHRWYAEMLDLPIDGADYTVIRSAGGETLTWACFPADTNYFGARQQATMVNYRVDDLGGVLERLRQARVPIEDHIEEHEYGRFGWATDPEGNRFELWEPAPGH